MITLESNMLSVDKLPQHQFSLNMKRLPLLFIYSVLIGWLALIYWSVIKFFSV